MNTLKESVIKAYNDKIEAIDKKIENAKADRESANVEIKENESEKIKVVLLEPGKVARATEIDASLKGMQKIVSGNIDVVSLSDALLIHNREGKERNLPFNRGLCDETGKVRDVIAGTCFICDSREDEFIGLSEKQTKEYLKRFKYPERFYRTGDGITKVPYNPNKNKDYER